MSKAVNDYIKKFNEAAEKIANDETFQKTLNIGEVGGNR